MELAEVVGQLVGLRRFPIEPFSGESPNEIAVRAEGVVGDRAFELVGSDGEILTWRSAPQLLLYSARYLESLVVDDLDQWTRIGLPDGREVPMGQPDWIADVARRLGKPVSVRRAAAAGGQSFVHLISRPTLKFAERVYGAALEPRWLRANFVMELTGGKAFEEDEWVGRQVRVGDTLCDVVAPSAECLAVAFRPENPAGDVTMLEGLLKVRGGMLGLQVRVARGQRIRVGDTVSLVD